MPVGPIHHGGRGKFPAQVVHFVDLFRLRSIPYVIGPTEEFGSTNLPQIASSRIIYAPTGSEKSGFRILSARVAHTRTRVHTPPAQRASVLLHSDRRKRR